MHGFLLTALLLLFAPTIAAAQTPRHLIYRPIQPDTMFHALNGNHWAMVHYEMPDSIAPNNIVELDAPLPFLAQFGRRVQHTMVVPESHRRDYERVNEAYDSRDYDTAAERATELVMADPENPFFIDAYARALFRIADRRTTARDAYMRLMQILDGQVSLGDGVVTIDVHFLEAYGKLAALHLDAEHYDSAAFESTRALVAAYHNQVPETWQFIDLQLSQLTEAYAEMGQDDHARWFGGAALRWNPANQPVLPYLRQVGAKPERIVSCMQGGSEPGEGNYVLTRLTSGDGGPLQCLSPQEDSDGTIGPCLRIGEVFIGLGEAETHSSIGNPMQSVTLEDGSEAYMHLLFNDFSSGEGAYYVVQYEEVDGERVVSSIQLTGQKPPVSYSCSCVELGEPEEVVERQFGPPTSVEEFEMDGSGIKGNLWSYEPSPLTFEIVDGIVHSIRVWRPDHLPPQRRRPSLFYKR